MPRSCVGSVRWFTGSRRRWWPALTLIATAAFAGPRDPSFTQTDLIVATEGGSKIFVEATLPGGLKGFFVVDTGAEFSVVSNDIAEQLHLTTRPSPFPVAGLSGTVDVRVARLDSVAVGDFEVTDLKVGVGVPGVPTSIRFMPVAGILGNDVWSQFAVEIDYRGSTLTLHKPGTYRSPAGAAPMWFDGAFVTTPVQITTHGYTTQVVLAVDTGHTDLMFLGSSGNVFKQGFTEGVEPVYGIRATSRLPAWSYLQTTRRIEVDRLKMGGFVISDPPQARWLNPRQAVPADVSSTGFVGHAVLEGHRVLFNFADRTFSMRRARGGQRVVLGQRELLDADIAEHGDAPERGLYRGRLALGLEDLAEGRRWLRAFVNAPHGPPSEREPAVRHPERLEAQGYLAHIHRMEGEFTAAGEVLAEFSADDLVQWGELVAQVNALVLEGKIPKAEQLATQAVEVREDAPAAWIALSDALLAAEKPEEAADALRHASTLDPNPSSHLLRRSRVALALGDHFGALALLRELVDLYPGEGKYLWFYASMMRSTDTETFRADMASAIHRLHPKDHPLDFLVAAQRALGEDATALGLMHQGVEEDCKPLPTPELRDNCVAWYYTLAGHDLDQALDRITRALDTAGQRSDFLDTKAMVHYARREFDLAERSSVVAARMNPDDPYLLWQADRHRLFAQSPTESP